MGIDIETLAAARKYAKKAAKEEGVNQNFYDDFVTNETTTEFCKSIAEHPNVKQGNSFLGAVTLTDMPFTGNAECRIDVIHSQLGGFILALELISATESPYRWYGIYWNKFSGWQALITDAHLQSEYSIDISEETGGDYAKVYIVKQGDEVISRINIPKDMVVSSGAVVENPDGYPAGKYIELTLANADDSKIYIALSDLVDEYTVHINAKTASSDGAHGLRYYNGALQYDDNGEWKTLSISDLLI